MARQTYTRARRQVMQIVMCLILGATVGLAALVDYQRKRTFRVQLDAPTTYGDLTIRLPKRWEILTDSTGGPADPTPGVVVQASDIGRTLGIGGGLGRTITITRQQLRELVSPIEYLRMTVPGGNMRPSNFLISPGGGRDGSGDDETGDDEDGGGAQTSVAVSTTADESTEPITIGGRPGVLLTREHRITIARGMQMRNRLFLACTILPSRQAITVRLDSISQHDADDVNVLKQVAAGIKFEREPALARPQGPIELPGGVRVTAPEQFLLAPTPQGDKSLRIDRQLWLDPSSKSTDWTTIELIPCVLVGEQPENVLSLAALHGARWRGAIATSDGPRRWRIEPDQSAGGLFPARAYVISDPGGQALLAIFRGGSTDTYLFDKAWQTIADGAQFTGNGDATRAMLDTGAAEAGRIADAGLKQIVPEVQALAWWQWHLVQGDQDIGWTKDEHDLMKWAGARETRRRSADGHVTRVTQTWEGTPDLQNYRAAVERIEDSPKSQDSLKHGTLLSGGKSIKTSLSTGQGKTIPAALASPPPKQFIPGGWLPLLMGRLGDKPIIIRTDAVPGFEGLATPDLLTLVVTRESAKAVLVQVSGASQVSRWTFKDDGSLDSIDVGGEMRCVRSDLQTIRFAFGHDKKMTP